MLVMAWFSHTYALEPLYVSVHADRSVDVGISVTIYGQVTGLNQSAVALAAVSIQVNDPYGSSVHIALLYSDSNGTYSDEFQLPAGLRETTQYTSPRASPDFKTLTPSWLFS